MLLSSLVSKSNRWIDRGLHHLLPRVCSLCEQNLEGDRECAARLCQACEERLPGRSALRCLRCGLTHLNALNEGVFKNHSSMPDHGCGLDQQEQFPWDGVIAWVDYDYPVDGWIHALKFQREASLAHGLGWGLAQAILHAPLELQKRVSQLDALIPLPLSRQRLAKRGFNQAQLIAQSLRTALLPNEYPLMANSFMTNNNGKSITVNHFPRKHHLRLDLLSRTKDGPAMSLLASPGRHHLVKDAYQVPWRKTSFMQKPWAKQNPGFDQSPTQTQGLKPLQGLRLGLIDDVMTTGATLAEATSCLKAAGASEVIVLVAARTP